VIKQPFHAADFKIERPFDFTWLTDLTMAPPLSLEAAGTSSQRVRYSSDRNKPGMLTLAEVDEAEREIKKVIAPIAGRTYVDISAYAPNDSGYDNSPEAQRARDEAIELRRAGPNGISFREAQKQRYYRAISKSPLMIFLPRPNPSVDELIKAYGEKLSLAQERLNELSSNATTIGLDHS
jgi:hypothetical protein